MKRSRLYLLTLSCLIFVLLMMLAPVAPRAQAAGERDGAASGLLYLPYVAHDASARQGEMILVSVASDGILGDDRSSDVSLSASGRFVAFASAATNLVGGDSNGWSDIFVHDMQNGETSRVSVAGDGTQGDGDSWSPAISADGRFVAFASSATNLVDGDTNDAPDIFVHDRQTGEIAMVSVAGDGTQGNLDSLQPAISANGSLVAFYSWADNLVPADGNGTVLDIFVHDRQTKETMLVSVASDGTQGNGNSISPAISADGRFVAFESEATNLLGDPVNDENVVSDIFVHDRLSGETTRVSVSGNGSESNGPSYSPAISADGRFVAFESPAGNLVDGDTNGTYDVFVHDRQMGETTMVSMAGDGAQGNLDSLQPAISADGRFVAYYIFENAVFLHDRQTGTTTPVSKTAQGTLVDGSFPAISGDGHLVAFESDAGNLVEGDTNNEQDIFVYDRLPE